MYYELVVFIVLVFLGFVFGRHAEQKHFKSILQREKDYAALLAFSERFPPPDLDVRDAALVAGSVVVSIDYFKRIAAGLRSFFGGRIAVYESLIERARREAILRMKEEAMARGASMIVNVKLETASITKGAEDQIGAVEVYAYGTALVTQDTSVNDLKP
jgi:uncharacterized protein YbjQ (UPF0145 family)